MRMTFTLAAALVAAASPLSALATVYNLPPDSPPTSLAAGDTMNVFDGAATTDVVEAYAGSTINLYGGAMGLVTNLYGDLNIYGGRASSTTWASGGTINVFNGSTGGLYLTNSVLNVHGGQIDGLVNANNGTINMAAGDFIFQSLSDSTVNMTGGRILVGFPYATVRTTFNVSNGELGDLTLRDGSKLNLRGGSVVPNSRFTVLPDATAHLFVRSALLNGMTVPGLVHGVAVPINVINVDGQLDVVLQNGSPFSFSLSTRSLLQLDPRPAGALISTNPSNADPGPVRKIEVLLTLIPEPAAATMAVTCVAVWAGIARGSRRSFSRRVVC
jgi:autotransporter passenger strand-loop-strand repeat protein